MVQLKKAEFEKQHLQIHHVDNQGDCYALTKAASMNIWTDAVVKTMLNRNVQDGQNFYYAWISTHRNVGADAMTRCEKLEQLLKEYPHTIIVSPPSIPWEDYIKTIDECEKLQLLELPLAHANKRQLKKDLEKRAKRLKIGE
jgi:hypothetical protein